MKMTNKQRRFCEEYLIDLNATQAAIRSGYSKKTAHKIGTENLQKPVIREYLDKSIREKESQLIATQDEVLRYLTSVLRGESESEIVVVEGQGDGVSYARPMTKRPDEQNRLKAAEQLAKYYGLTNVQKIEGSLTVPLIIKDDIPEDDE